MTPKSEGSFWRFGVRARVWRPLAPKGTPIAQKSSKSCSPGPNFLQFSYVFRHCFLHCFYVCSLSLCVCFYPAPHVFFGFPRPAEEVISIVNSSRVDFTREITSAIPAPMCIYCWVGWGGGDDPPQASSISWDDHQSSFHIHTMMMG